MNEWIAKYVGAVDKILSMIPYGRTKAWKEFFFNPSETVGKNIDGFVQRIIDLYVTQTIVVIIAAIMLVPMYALSGELGTMVKAFGNPLIIGLAAALLAILPFLSILYTGIEFIFAKILGGKADFKTHMNASILSHLAVWTMQLPALIVSIPFGWLSGLPIISCCAGILGMPIKIVMGLLGVYTYYLKYLAFKEVHKVSQIRSVAIILLPILFIVAIIVVIAVLLAVFLAASLGTLVAATGRGA